MFTFFFLLLLWVKPIIYIRIYEVEGYQIDNYEVDIYERFTILGVSLTLRIDGGLLDLPELSIKRVLIELGSLTRQLT